MKTFLQFLTRPITTKTHDGQFVRWVCSGAAVAVFILAVILFCRQAQSLAELMTGLTLALLTCAALVLTGESTTRLHFALLRHKLPLRSRCAEFAGYVGTLSILNVGLGYLSTLSLNRSGMTMGLLLILSVSMAASCLGAWSSLRAVRVKARLSN